jgi:hypothetical protein
LTIKSKLSIIIPTEAKHQKVKKMSKPMNDYNENNDYELETDESVVISKTSKREKGQVKHGAKSARRVQRKRRANR